MAVLPDFQYPESSMDSRIIPLGGVKKATPRAPWNDWPIPGGVVSGGFGARPGVNTPVNPSQAASGLAAINFPTFNYTDPTGGQPLPRETQGEKLPWVEFNAPAVTAGADEAFNRAKDKTGLVARSAITGLSSALAGSGNLGGGVQGRGVQSILNQGQQNLADVTRERAIQEATLNQRNAETEYAGRMGQRQSDLSQQTARDSMNVAQRGQDASMLSDFASRALQSAIAPYQAQVNKYGTDVQAREAGLSREQAAAEAAKQREFEGQQNELSRKNQQALAGLTDVYGNPTRNQNQDRYDTVVSPGADPNAAYRQYLQQQEQQRLAQLGYGQGGNLMPKPSPWSY